MSFSPYIEFIVQESEWGKSGQPPIKKKGADVKFGTGKSSITQTISGRFSSRIRKRTSHILYAFEAATERAGFLGITIHDPLCALVFTLKGNPVVLASNNNRVPLTRNYYFLICLPPGAAYVRVSRGITRAILLTLSAKNMDDVSKLTKCNAGTQNLFTMEKTRLLGDSFINRDIYTCLHHITQVPGFGYRNELEIERLVDGIITQYTDSLEHISNLRDHPQHFTREAAALAERYILENYASSNGVRLNQLSGMFHVTEKTLRKEFQLLTGLTIADYVKKTRLEKAAQLIDKGASSLFEVVEAIGYSETTNFIRDYKNLYKVLPGKQIRSRTQRNS